MGFMVILDAFLHDFVMISVLLVTMVYLGIIFWFVFLARMICFFFVVFEVCFFFKRAILTLNL